MSYGGEAEARRLGRVTRQRLRRDPVTAEVRAAVIARDKGCVALMLGATTPCRDRWGNALPLQGRYSPSQLELDHIRPEPMMGKRAPSDAAHLATFCSHHHRDGFATSHRSEIRNYLRRVSGDDAA